MLRYWVCACSRRCFSASRLARILPALQIGSVIEGPKPKKLPAPSDSGDRLAYVLQQMLDDGIRFDALTQRVVVWNDAMPQHWRGDAV